MPARIPSLIPAEKLHVPRQIFLRFAGIGPCRLAEGWRRARLFNGFGRRGESRSGNVDRRAGRSIDAFFRVCFDGRFTSNREVLKPGAQKSEKFSSKYVDDKIRNLREQGVIRWIHKLLK